MSYNAAMPSARTAVYAFSGDPTTYGHLDIIQRALQLFNKVIVAIGTNPDKNYTFTAQQRKQLAETALQHLQEVAVKRFTGLLVDFAYEQGATAIIKGVRDSTDFQYEQTLNSVGLSQNHGLETIILFAKPELAHISSSTVKALQQAQGLVHQYVPLSVKVVLEKELSNQVMIGITGEIASGKTYVAEQLVKIGKKQGREVYNIDLDSLAHQIQNELKQPPYKKVRQQLLAAFGTKIQNNNGTINRKKLGEIVFNNLTKLEQLNQIMWKPVLVRLRQELQGKQGMIIINSALLAEADLLQVCNNRVIFVDVNQTTQRKRLKERKLSTAQINRRLKSQLSADKKRSLIKQSIKQYHFGKLWQVTEKTSLESFVNKLIKKIS